MVTYQVRNLLRFHQVMGLSGFPGGKESGRLFSSRKTDPVVNSPMRSRDEKSMVTTAEKTPRSLSSIRHDIAKCRRCPLGENRLGQVIGNNPQRARLMVAGDWSHQQGDFSPHLLMGRKEDIMLRKMMAAIGQNRDRVFVTNVVKCCPADIGVDNESIRLCGEHLEREIASVQPEIILAMGTVAASILVDADGPLVRLRGKFYPCRLPGCQSILVMVSFHPCFLAGNTEMKKMAWQDLQTVQRQLLIS